MKAQLWFVLAPGYASKLFYLGGTYNLYFIVKRSTISRTSDDTSGAATADVSLEH